MVVALEKYNDLVRWMVENNVHFSSLLTVNRSPLGGIGVFARKKIPKNSALLAVPKTAILSPVTYVWFDTLCFNFHNISCTNIFLQLWNL